MMEAFRNGGVMMWPMLVVALGIGWIVVRTAARMRRDPDGDEVRRGLLAILFWGGMAVLLGALGTVVGLAVAADAVARVPELAPALVWSGIGVTLITLIFGLLIFLFAALSWFALRAWAVRRAQHA